MMRAFVAVALLSLLMPDIALAQSAVRPPPPAAIGPGSQLVSSEFAAFLQQPQPVQRDTVSGGRGRCCNRKGALIGLVVGAGSGWLLSRFCDGGNCGWETVKTMAITGALGAGIGSFVPK